MIPYEKWLLCFLVGVLGNEILAETFYLKYFSKWWWFFSHSERILDTYRRKRRSEKTLLVGSGKKFIVLRGYKECTSFCYFWAACFSINFRESVSLSLKSNEKLLILRKGSIFIFKYQECRTLSIIRVAFAQWNFPECFSRL